MKKVLVIILGLATLVGCRALPQGPLGAGGGTVIHTGNVVTELNSLTNTISITSTNTTHLGGIAAAGYAQTNESDNVAFGGDLSVAGTTVLSGVTNSGKYNAGDEIDLRGQNLTDASGTLKVSATIQLQSGNDLDVNGGSFKDTSDNVVSLAAGQTLDGSSGVITGGTVYATHLVGLAGADYATDAEAAALTNSLMVEARNAANHTNRPFYFELSLIPTNAAWDVVWGMPWDEARTLTKVWAQTDQSTCTLHVVEAVSNNMWRTYTTNNASIVAVTNGVWDTSWADSAVAAGSRLGVKIVNFGASCSNLTFGARGTY